MYGRQQAVDLPPDAGSYQQQFVQQPTAGGQQPRGSEPPGGWAGAGGAQFTGPQHQAGFPQGMPQMQGFGGGFLPGLSSGAEQQLAANIRELSIIEGNINPNGSTRVVYVSSCFAGEGKTITAISTAYALAVLGNKRVLLIDAHWAAPSIARLFNANGQYGWYEYLFSDAPVEQLAQQTRYGTLFLMAAGSAMQGQAMVCEAERLRRRLLPLRDRFDYIVLDGASITASSEVTMVSSAVDAVLLVVTCEKTKWEVVAMARDKIAAAGGRLGGVILNRRKYYIPGTMYRKLSRK